MLLSEKETSQEIIQGSKSKDANEEVNAMLTSNFDQNCENPNLNSNSDQNSKEESDDLIEIRAEDIVDELNYWSLCVALYIYGANPKIGMVDGFARRLWGNMNVDKVIPVKPSMFMVRFLNDDAKEKALNAKHVMFDSHPVFIKQWHDELDFDPKAFKIASVWVQLPDLPLRYWGCIMKLAKELGEPVQLDMATRKRERIQYARVLVEMDITKEFPKYIKFKNEKGMIVEQQTFFEWRPSATVPAVARPKKTTQVWRPKQMQSKDTRTVAGHERETARADNDSGVRAAAPNAAPKAADGGRAVGKANDDGFQPVKKGASSQKSQTSVRNTAVSNHFEVIQFEDVTDGNEDDDDRVRLPPNNQIVAHG